MVFYISLCIGWIGGHAVVVGKSENDALRLTLKQCKSAKVVDKSMTMKTFRRDIVSTVGKIKTRTTGVQAFHDGDY